MKEATETVINAVKPIAEKIGEGAEHLYGVYIKQMVVEGVTSIIVSITLIITTVVLARVLISLLKRAEWRCGDPDNAAAGFSIATGAALVLVSLAAVIQVVFTANTAPTKLLNPEYHAVERIIDQVTNKGQ